MIKKWTKWLEKRICKSNLLIDLYGIYYKNIVKNEINLAKLSKEDTILCIGGGAVPSTALQMASQTGASVHIIDVDKIAVDRAMEIINRRGLSRQITVSKIDGKNINIEGYSAIHIALQVGPKEAVLKNLWIQAKKDTKIIMRIAKKNLNNFYSNISDEFLEENHMKCSESSINTRLNTMDRALVMIKE